MALIKCSECEREVSSKAKSCPNCGGPLDEMVSDKVMMNPKTGEIEEYGENMYVAHFFFGPFYLLYKGCYVWALLSLIAIIITSGFAHLVLIFMVGRILKKHRREQGWVKADKKIEKDIMVKKEEFGKKVAILILIFFIIIYLVNLFGK